MNVNIIIRNRISFQLRTSRNIKMYKHFTITHYSFGSWLSRSRTEAWLKLRMCDTQQPNHRKRKSVNIISLLLYSRVKCDASDRQTDFCLSESQNSVGEILKTVVQRSCQRVKSLVDQIIDKRLQLLFCHAHVKSAFHGRYCRHSWFEAGKLTA